MKEFRKTKIVCTLGPASRSPEVLKKLIDAGLDVARINFSHGTREDHAATIRTIREICGNTWHSVAILQDLCGPKIRVGNIAGGIVQLKAGQTFVLTSAERVGDVTGAHVSYERLADEVPEGASILIDDGLLELVAEKVAPPEIRCRVIVGGPLSSRKGVNFPGVTLSIPALTEKDREDVLFGLSQGVDLVALSFVQRPEDIFALKEVMNAAGRSVPIIAKIEMAAALEHLQGIIDVADGVMVARGDLGVETPMERLPLVQKQIIDMAREQGKPVITATQMLDSMIRNPRPTRAEVTDVANAILDGTDAVMLSAETASGAWPVQAVEVMSRIAFTTEGALPYTNILTAPTKGRGILDVISLAACEMAEEIGAKALVVFSTSGRSVRKIASYRPRAPILALTDDPQVARQLRLSWGVLPQEVDAQTNTDHFIHLAESKALATELFDEGDLVVLSAGFPMGVPGSTNTLQVRVLGRMFLRGQAFGPAEAVRGRLTLVRDGAPPPSVQEGDVLAFSRWNPELESLLDGAAAAVFATDCLPRGGEAALYRRSLPHLVGVAGVFDAFHGGEMVTVDGTRGIIFV